MQSGEDKKKGRTVGERYKVSSKTEGLETLEALRRESGPLATQPSGQALVLSQHRQSLSWVWLPPLPAPTAPLNSLAPISAHAL